MGLENKLVTVMDMDTLKHTERFIANYPNLNSLRGFLAGQWDLEPFNHCFKGRNRLGDVDASLELNGHTLVVEFKGSKNGMNKGQVLKAIRQAKYSAITTIFIFGKRNEPEAYLTIEPAADTDKGYRSSGYITCTFEEVCEVLKAWGDYAEANNLVKSKTEEWNGVTEVLSSLYNG